MEEKNEGRINIEDLPPADHELTAEEARDVKGGIGHLLPAVQKARDAANSSLGNTYRGKTTVSGSGE